MDDSATLANSTWAEFEDVIGDSRTPGMATNRPEIIAYLPTGAGRARPTHRVGPR